MFLNFRGVKISLVGSVWQLKLPLKIKLFIWLTLQGKILTQDVFTEMRLVRFFLVCVLWFWWNQLITYWLHNNFNRHNNRDIFLILDSFHIMCVCSVFIMCTWLANVKISNWVIFQVSSFFLRSFYFNVSSQLFLYIRMKQRLGVVVPFWWGSWGFSWCSRVQPSSLDH
jgi:hypothetical protein